MKFARNLMLLGLLAAATVMTSSVNAFQVRNKADSKMTIMVVGERFESPAKWEGRIHNCPSGSFHDPRKGGECWKCGKNTKRTVFPVNGKKACQKKGQVIFGGYSKAQYIKKVSNKCRKGTFKNGAYNQCYSCPTGFRRSTVIASDLTKKKNACIGKTYFQKKIAAGKRANGFHKNPVYNLSGNPEAVVRLTVYAGQKKCGYHTRPLKKGKTPGLNPTQKACHIISFSMKANAIAAITAYEQTSYVQVLSSRGKSVKLYCNPVQPPAPGYKGVTCSKSEKPLKQYQF